LGGGSESAGGSSDAVGALVVALGANTTEVARQALADMIAGKIKTEMDDAAATQLALGAMAENITGKHGETLFQSLTKPDQFRPAQGSVTAATLQQSAVAVLDAKDLPALRYRIAQQITAVAEAYRKPLIEMLLQQRSDNARSQIQLYAAGVLDDAQEKGLQSAFAGYGRQAINQLMGVSDQVAAGGGYGGGVVGGLGGGGGNALGGAPVPGAAGPGGGAPVPGAAGPGGGGFSSGDGQSQELKPEQVNELLAGMWTAQFAGEVAKSVSRGNDAEALRLGATMPLSPVRKSFQALIDANRQKSPEGLIQAQALEEVIRDPGLLIAIKTIPWKNRPKQATDANQGGYGSGLGAPGAGGPRAPGGDQGAKKENRSGDSTEKWRDATESLVRGLFARFAAANRKENVPPAPPIKVPKGEIKAEYYLKWPDELPDNLKNLGIAPMTIHYLQIETKDPNAATNLSTQVKMRRTHGIPGGFWYENRLTHNNGMLSSLDVMVTKSNPDGGGFGAVGGAPAGGYGASGGRGKEKALQLSTVDMLYIEIGDYTK